MPEELALAVILAALSLAVFARPREARGRSVPGPDHVPARLDRAESVVRDQLYGGARSSHTVVIVRPGGGDRRASPRRARARR
jgi:hypothetical protein